MKKVLDSQGVHEIIVQCLNKQEQSSHHSMELRSEETYDSSWWEQIIWHAIHTNDQGVPRMVEYVAMTGVMNCGLDRRKVFNLSMTEKTNSA